MTEATRVQKKQRGRKVKEPLTPEAEKKKDQH